MNSSLSPSPQLGKSTYSSGARREVLWNVVQPGDPYDIRKSMIAKLPGERQHFMGDNLEVVCLFQSAQIQRLSQFLDDYKFRYRQIERRQLDRHSYEIQIKQLTQQLVNQGSIRSQNNKLKQFIKKQTLQIQQLKSNKFQFDNNLRANYEAALIQVQSLIRQNQLLKSEKDKFVIQINSFTARIQALQSTRQRQLRELYNKYAQQNKYVVQNETKSLKSRYQSQINRLQLEIKRLKQFNQAKNQQINNINSKNRNLLIQIQQLQNQNNQYDSQYVKKLQQRFTLMGQQIQRLNLRIKQSTSRIDQSARNELYWKDRYKHLQEDYKSIQVRYRQVTDKFQTLNIQLDKLSSQNQTGKYQDQIKRLNSEIKRLQQQRSNESQRYTLLQRKYSQLQYNYSKISIIQRQNAQLKENQSNIKELKRRLAQYETKVALLSQEIQRLNSIARNSSLQKQGFDQLKINFQEYRRKSVQNQRTITQKYQSQMQRKILQYESRLAKFSEQSGNQFQIRLQAINRQVQKLNQYLKQKTEQSDQYKRRIRELQNSINQKYQIQVKRQYASYESTITQLKNRNDELNRKNRESSNLSTRIAQYQNKIVLFNQEVQRLNYALKMKVDQLQGLRRVNRQLQMKYQNNANLDIQVNRKISFYQESQSKLTRQNEDLKRKLQQIVQLNRRLRQYEDRIRIMTQDNERISLNLRQKIEALNRSENNLKMLSQQIQSLRRNRLQIQTSFNQKLELDKMETSRKFTNYQQSLSSIQRQYDELRRRMLDMGNDSNRKVSEYENKIVLLTQQIQRLNQTFKIKINDYQNAILGLRNELELSRKKNKDLQITITQKYELETSRKIGMYQHNMSGLSRELEQLRRRINEYQNTLRKKNEEVSTLQNRYRVVSQQYESFKYQVKSFQGQVNRSQSSYQQNLSRLTRQHEQTKRRIAEYQNRIVLLTQQNERLNAMLRNGQQQQQTLRRTISQLKIEITQKYQVQTSRKINGYQQNLNALNRQKQELRRKIVQYQNLIANFRRQAEEKNRRIIEWENKYRQIQVTITQKYQMQSSRKITNYEQNIQNLNRQLQNLKLKLIQYENLRVNYQKQINRLNGLIKNNQSQVTRHITIYQQNISTLNIQVEDFKRKLMNTDQITKNQAIELEQLRRRLKQHGDISRTIVQYENQFVMIRQQLQRVNITLKTKIDELNISQNKLRAVIMQNQDLKRKIKQVQITIVNKYQYDMNQNMGNAKRQNDDLRRRIAQLQNKVALLSQQNQRINNMFKMKIQQLNQSELRSRNWQQQIENLRRRLQQTERSSNVRIQQNMITITRQYDDYKRQSARRIAQLQNKVALLSQQLERATYSLRSRGEDSEVRYKNSLIEIQRLQRALRQLQVNSGKNFNTQKTTIISTYEQKMIVIARQLEDYKLQSNRKYVEYENRILQLTRELDRVNVNANRKDDTGNFQRTIMQLTQQNQNLKRQVRESELQFNQRYQIQISRKVSTYEQNFISMKSQLENLDRKNKQYARKVAQDQNRISLLSQQIERLNLKINSNSPGSQNTGQIQRLNIIIRQKSDQILSLQQKLTQAQGGQGNQLKQLQSSYSLISKQYENSKKHLEQYEQSIRKLYSQFERLQVIINQLKVQRQTLFDKNHGLIKQIQRLTTQNKDQETQIYELRLKFSDQVSLQKRINQHMALMVVLFAQIQTLRQRVKDKQNEVRQVRRSSLAPLKA